MDAMTQAGIRVSPSPAALGQTMLELMQGKSSAAA
jgi:hypothetical protein